MSELKDTPGGPSSPLRGEGSGEVTRHPAKYPDSVLAIFQEFVNEHRYRGGEAPKVLDPFAGVGRIHELLGCATTGIELEPEWAEQAHKKGNTIQGDALMVMRHPGMHEAFDFVMVSPTYGNRMADTYDGRDGSTRHTYTTSLGRTLSDNSSAGLQWGDDYRDFHEEAWALAYDVLKPGGMLLINIKDHIRKGARQPVTSWHRAISKSLGFRHLDDIVIPMRGLQHGQNHEKRIDHESIIVLEKPA